MSQIISASGVLAVQTALSITDASPELLDKIKQVHEEDDHIVGPIYVSIATRNREPINDLSGTGEEDPRFHADGYYFDSALVPVMTDTLEQITEDWRLGHRPHYRRQRQSPKRRRSYGSFGNTPRFGT